LARTDQIRVPESNKLLSFLPEHLPDLRLGFFVAEHGIERCSTMICSAVQPPGGKQGCQINSPLPGVGGSAHHQVLGVATIG